MPNFTGTPAGETLTGTAMDDFFDGGGGADTFVGLAGDDGYLVDSTDDVVTEVAGEGTDRVYAALSYTLGAGTSVEILTVASSVGAGAIDLTGNELGQHLWGNDGVNILRGMGGTDWLFGYGGDDRLEGGADTDYLIGGAGADVLLGGAGDDLYLLDDALDTITEEDGEGFDVIYVNFTYTLAAGEEIEFLATGANIVSTAAINLTGNEYNNLIVANNGANILTGDLGTDVIYGEAGTDTIYGDAGNDTLVGGADNDVIHGGTENDALFGDGGADELRGGDGDDSFDAGSEADTLYGDGGNDGLDGGSGADVMDGGSGDDYFIVDDALDTVVETSTGGTDRIYASVSYTLGAGSDVEMLFAGGPNPLAAINLTGNGQGNNIYGNEGVNTLDGGFGDDWLFGFGGSDTLIGGAGNDYLSGGAGIDLLDGGANNDTYFVDEFDTIADSGGTDVVYISGNFALTAGPAIELMIVTGDVLDTVTVTITGNDTSGTISGHGGINIIDGGGGDDVIYGYGGNDQLNGGDGDDTLYGGDGDDHLISGTGTGNAILYGEAGNDTLEGIRTMRGGIGDDIYYGIGANAFAQEFAGEGYDIFYVDSNHVQNSNTYVEEVIAVAGTANIEIRGNGMANILRGNAGANLLTGESGDDEIYGNDGDDRLFGGAGVDELYGGNGNDELYDNDNDIGEGPFPESLLDGGDGDDYIVFGNNDRAIGGDGNDTFEGDAHDATLIGGLGNDIYDLNAVYYNTIVELDGEGTDTIISSNSFTLAAGLSIEVMIVGGPGSVFTGNELANLIIGDETGTLDGGGGNDRLVRDDGRGGMMTGGTGDDVFVFAHQPTWNGNSYFDEITDFIVGEDTIELDGFFAIPAGQLAAGAFHTGSAAADAADRIIYDSATGKLFYDADGTGGAAQVHFATVSTGLALDHTSFFGI